MPFLFVFDGPRRFRLFRRLEKELSFLTTQDPSVLMQLGTKNGFARAQGRLSPIAAFLELSCYKPQPQTRNSTLEVAWIKSVSGERDRLVRFQWGQPLRNPRAGFPHWNRFIFALATSRLALAPWRQWLVANAADSCTSECVFESRFHQPERMIQPASWPPPPQPPKCAISMAARPRAVLVQCNSNSHIWSFASRRRPTHGSLEPVWKETSRAPHNVGSRVARDPFAPGGTNLCS